MKPFTNQVLFVSSAFKKEAKVILNNDKYICLYDIIITKYTVSGVDKYNEKWIFPKSIIKEILM